MNHYQFYCLERVKRTYFKLPQNKKLRDFALTPKEARQEREAGRQEGKQEGRQEGMAEGRQEVLAMLSETQREKIMQRLGERKNVSL